jgi:hypothetical protein
MNALFIFHQNCRDILPILEHTFQEDSMLTRSLIVAAANRIAICIVTCVGACIAPLVCAGPAQLTLSSQGVVNDDYPASSEFGALNAGDGFVLTTSIVYDTLGVSDEGTGILAWGPAGFTLTSGAMTVISHVDPENTGFIVAREQLDLFPTDGYDHSLSLYMGLFLAGEGALNYELWQTIRWQDDAFTAGDVLRTMGTMAFPAEARLSTGIVVRQAGERIDEAGFTADSFTLAVTAVPEPRAAILLLPGLALCYLAARRQRQA